MTSTSQRVIRVRHRVRIFLLYAIASVVIALALLKTSSVVEDQWGHDALFKWGSLTLFTLILFLFFIGASENYFGSRRFWVMTTILLIVHLTVFTLVLAHVDGWGVTWLIFFEYPIFVFLREALVTPR